MNTIRSTVSIRRKTTKGVLLAQFLSVALHTQAYACMRQEHLNVSVEEAIQFGAQRCEPNAPFYKAMNKFLGGDPEKDASVSLASGQTNLRRNVWYAECNFPEYNYYSELMCQGVISLQSRQEAKTYISAYDYSGGPMQQMPGWQTDWCYQAVRAIADHHVDRYNLTILSSPSGRAKNMCLHFRKL
jgi:hypothetical protein